MSLLSPSLFASNQSSVKPPQSPAWWGSSSATTSKRAPLRCQMLIQQCGSLSTSSRLTHGSLSWPNASSKEQQQLIPEDGPPRNRQSAHQGLSPRSRCSEWCQSVRISIDQLPSRSTFHRTVPTVQAPIISPNLPCVNFKEWGPFTKQIRKGNRGHVAASIQKPGPASHSWRLYPSLLPSPPPLRPIPPHPPPRPPHAPQQERCLRPSERMESNLFNNKWVLLGARRRFPIY